MGPGFREPVNALSHLVGAVLALVGSVLLVVRANGDPWKVYPLAVYGLTLVALFAASTALHATRAGEPTLRRLRILDHAAIFLLIAGSYTPVVLIAMRPDYPISSWILFSLVWTLALLGVVFKVAWISAPRWLSTALYLLLGWLALLGIVPIVETVPAAGLVWLLVGGFFYSLGAVIYGLKRPDPIPGVFGYHEIWHLFVLAGALSHYLTMAQLLTL